MKNIDIELPPNRKFGFFFTAVFIIIGSYLLIKGYSATSYAAFSLAVVFLIITLLNAELLLPLNKLWMKFGLLLGMIISPIVLGVIFFGLFTPISFFMKLIGRDELRLKLRERESHWKERSISVAQADAFKYQF